jgi:hypothetical protein
MIDRAQVQKCSDVLQSDFSTNFEIRMVAEINLYWIMYDCCSGPTVDLPKTQTALHAWRQDWKNVLGEFVKYKLEHITDDIYQTNRDLSFWRWVSVLPNYWPTKGR